MSRIGLTSKISQSLSLAETQEDKLSILQKYKNESLIKRLVSYAYNPMIIYDMDDWEPHGVGKLDGLGISKFIHVIEEIAERKFDKKEAFFAANLVLSHINDEEAHIFIGVLKKNLTWDLAPETISAVWDDINVGYPIQYPSNFSQELIDQIQYPAVVQKLSRGLRVNIVVDGEKVTCRLSDGTIINNFSIYNEQFIELAQRNFTAFDGHAVKIDGDNNITSTDHDEILNSDPSEVRFIFWDAIRGDGLVNGADTRIGYNWRFNGLEHMMFLAIDKVENPAYACVEHKVVNHWNDVVKFLKDNETDGVLKNLPGTWRIGVTPHEVIIKLTDV
jgi:hypothetical protein